MTYFREMPGGFLAAPTRGVPPLPPDGYEPVPGNDFLFMIALPYCKYRVSKIEWKSCCGNVAKLHCIRKSINITRLDCKGCTYE